MAAVFAATHRNGHRVAIKFLLDHLVHDPDVYRLFTREAYVANDVAIPAPFPCSTTIRTTKATCFSSCPARRRDAARAMGAHRQAFCRSRRWGVLMLDALDVLASAHAKSIVHRDLKPR